MDASLGSHTAAFFVPFEDTPDDRGFFITLPEQMQEWALGKLADLVIVDRDITRIAAGQLRDARVQRTVIGGRTVYRRH
ncbi:MAG: hypothetical protein ABJ308_11075 [Halieaceae bacterium]